jgi:hypothetical protein
MAKSLGTHGPMVEKVLADGTRVKVSPPRRRTPSSVDGPAYIMLDMDTAVTVPDRLNRTQQKIMNVVLSEYRLGEPYCLLTASDIALRAGISRQNCAKAMKELVEGAWLFKISPKCWRVNAHYGHRGNREQWQEMKRMEEPPRW